MLYWFYNEAINAGNCTGMEVRPESTELSGAGQ